MFVSKKRWIGLLFIAVLAAPISIPLIPQQKVEAQVALADMCVPPVRELNSNYSVETGNQQGDMRGEHFDQADPHWLAIDVINRSKFQIIVMPEGKQCDRPQGIALQYLARSDTQGLFKSLVEGVAIDRDTGDGNWDYRKQSGGSSSDDTVIDNFSLNTRDPFGGNDARVDFLAGADRSEIVIGIEEDKLNGIADCRSGGDSNWNFVLRRYENQLQWRCEGSINNSWTGITLRTSSFRNAENFNILYDVIRGEDGEPVIQHVSPGEQSTRTFKWCPSVNQFRSQNCSGSLYIEGNDIRATLTSNASSNRIPLVIKRDGSSASLEVFASGENTTSAQLSNLGSDGTAPGEDVEPSCETRGGVMSWIVCPLINIIDGGLAWLDGAIKDKLEVDTNTFTGSELRNIWGRFRNLALIVLVPIMLVMVISTALGFSMFDAYTVKRAMPRFFVAVIFISLSWSVTSFMVELSNVVGRGILGVMTQPIGNDASLAGLYDPSAGQGIFTTMVAVGGVVWYAVGGGLTLPIIGLYAFMAFLAFLVAFLILTLRELLIIALTLFAPLAILAWIFPGNDKMWKLWWGTFTKLLLMFPIIMILIGSGRIFASVVENSRDDLVGTLLKITAYVAPYFFIPFTFKVAGGLFATLAGVVNDRSKGLFDRSRKSIGEKRKEAKERANTGRRFNPEKAKLNTFGGRMRRIGNNLGGWSADPLNSARIAMGTERGKALMDQIQLKKLEQTEKMAEVMSKAGFNAEVSRAIALGESRTDFKDAKTGETFSYSYDKWNGTLDDAERVATDLEKIYNRTGDRNYQIAAQTMRANANWLTRSFESEEYGRASIAGAAGLNLAGQGFAKDWEIAELSTMMGAPSEDIDALRTSGGTPSGLALMYKTRAELYAAKSGFGKPGYTTRIGENGEIVAGTKVARLEQATRYQTQEWASGKSSQLLEQFGEPIAEMLASENGTEIKDEYGQVFKVTQEAKDALEARLYATMSSPYSTPDTEIKVNRILRARAERAASPDIQNLKKEVLTGRGMAFSEDPSAANYIDNVIASDQSIKSEVDTRASDLVEERLRKDKERIRRMQYNGMSQEEMEIWRRQQENGGGGPPGTGAPK